METLGTWLRRAREKRGLTLEQVETATRIRKRMLELLEAGNFLAFPGGEVQARGFLRLYARFLGLPVEEALVRYNAEVHGIPVTAVGSVSQPEMLPSPLVAGMASDVAFASRQEPQVREHWRGVGTLLLGALVVVILITVLAGVSYLATQRANATEAPPATVVLPRRSSPDLALPVVIPTPSRLAQPSKELGEASEGITLTLKAVEHVWVEVKCDGQTVFRGILSPHDEVTWTAQQWISLETGNGAGVEAVVNRQPLGKLGKRGEVVRRVWGLVE